jgi:hypothetical protein
VLDSALHSFLQLLIVNAMRWQALYFCIAIFLSQVVESLVEVVNIIDASSVLSSYIKVFSIIKSSKRPEALSFRFLVLDDIDFGKLESMYVGCFPAVKVQFKRWERPSTLPPLSGKGFDADYIYSRVYLPDIFHEVGRYVYLDNDAVVNMDIADLYYTPLLRATHPMTTRLPRKPSRLQHPAARRDPGLGRNRPTSRQASATTTDMSVKVAMGFVFDVNEKLRGYVQNGFNQSSPLFKRAMSFIEPAKFFNGGVALVDAKKWRADNLTRRAEALIRDNQDGSLYSRRGLGDQGLFFLLLQDGVAELHPAVNMRRVPNKTTRFMRDHLGGEVNEGRWEPVYVYRVLMSCESVCICCGTSDDHTYT